MLSFAFNVYFKAENWFNFVVLNKLVWAKYFIKNDQAKSPKHEVYNAYQIISLI